MKPEINPQLSDFCINLTGISQVNSLSHTTLIKQNFFFLKKKDNGLGIRYNPNTSLQTQHISDIGLDLSFLISLFLYRCVSFKSVPQAVNKMLVIKKCVTIL